MIRWDVANLILINQEIILLDHKIFYYTDTVKIFLAEVLLITLKL